MLLHEFFQISQNKQQQMKLLIPTDLNEYGIAAISWCAMIKGANETLNGSPTLYRTCGVQNNSLTCNNQFTLLLCLSQRTSPRFFNEY